MSEPAPIREEGLSNEQVCRISIYVRNLVYVPNTFFTIYVPNTILMDKQNYGHRP